ncbi:hypothetical protein DL771_009306 [Monosporascus sp. 5C6A]|nr:hypothetical protein DL771_009306 [Monosporascus sp. 5C6A]
MICFQDFVPVFLVFDLLGRLYTTHEHPFWALIAILTNLLVFRMNDIYRTWSLAWVNFLISGYIGLHGNHDLYYDLWLLTLFCIYFLLIKAYAGSAFIAISLLRLQSDRNSEAKLWAYASLLLTIAFPYILAKCARITGISSFLSRLWVTIRIYFFYLIYITYFFFADISSSICVSSYHIMSTTRRLLARRLLAAAVCLDPKLNKPKPKTRPTFEVSNVVTTVDVVPRLPPVQAIATQTELLEEEPNTQVQAAFSPKPKPIPKILRVIQQRKAAAEVRSPRLNGSQRMIRRWEQRKEQEQREQEQREKEPIEKERLDKERLEKEQREIEQHKKEQLKKERLETEEHCEKERLGRERQEKQHQEKERQEKEKREKERQKEQLEREKQRDQQQPAPTGTSSSPGSVSAPASALVSQIADVGITAAAPDSCAPVPAGAPAQLEPEPTAAESESEPESESAPYTRIFPVEPAIKEGEPAEPSPQRPTIPIGERRILKPRSRKAKKTPEQQPEQQRQKEEQQELLQELQEELTLALMEDEPTPSQEPQKEQHHVQEQEQPQQMAVEATPLLPPRPLTPPQQLLPAAMDVDQPQESRFSDIKNINTSFLLSPPKKKMPSALVWPSQKASQPAAAAQPTPKPAKKEPPTEEVKKKVVADVMRRRKAQASSPFLPKKKPTPKKG